MKIKKFTLLISSLLILFFTSKNTFAVDNFIDNNANNFILTNNPNSKIIISEYNTGKIIAKYKEDEKIPYKNLISKLAIFLLSENIKNNKIKNTDVIEIIETDDITKKFNIEQSITIDDAIFILEQEPSEAIIKSIIKKFNVTISDFQLILDKLTMRDTELNNLDLSLENKTTAKNLAYLTETTIKNYPEITDITKNQKYKLKNEEEIDNNIIFIESDKIRSIGVSYVDSNSINIAYSGNTKVIVTILNTTEEKEEFFNSLQNLYEYIFENYQYKLALKAGTYDINEENITIDKDIFDLFYKEHSEKDIKYFLMNNKILFFQNYNYLSGNSGVVYSDYKNNNKKTNITKIKETFIQDSTFSEKNNKEKMSILINRVQYFTAFVLLIYSAIFLILYILKKSFTKGE